MPTEPDPVAQAAAAPQSISTDGLSVSEHSLSSQIEADKYQASKRAGKQASATGKKRSGFGMLRPAKAVPPSGVS